MQTIDTISIQNDAKHHERVQLFLSGTISIENVHHLHLAAEELLARGMNVRVDCSQVEHMDVAAIQVLIALAIDLWKLNRECRVVEIPPQIGNRMRIAGF